VLRRQLTVAWRNLAVDAAALDGAISLLAISEIIAAVRGSPIAGGVYCARFRRLALFDPMQ
jgi:hypothetical protein